MIKNFGHKQVVTLVNKGSTEMISLKNKTRNELIELAKNLSKGHYEKESKQRKQILQMIADKLAEKPGSPP